MPTKLARINSAIFFVLTAIFVINAMYSLAALYVSHFAAQDSANVVQDFVLLHFFPSYWVLPALHLVTALLLLFAALKLKAASRQSWLVGLGALLGIVINSVLVFNFVPSNNFDFYTTALRANEVVAEAPTIFESIVSALVNPVFAGPFVILLLSFTGFRHSAAPLSNAAKRVLIVVALLLVLPTAGALGYAYYMEVQPEQGYQELQALLPFPIYKPQSEFYQNQQSSKFFLRTENFSGLDGRVLAASVAYGESIVGSEDSLPLITVNQAAVGPVFDAKEYAAKLFEGENTVTPFSAPIASGRNSYIVESTGSFPLVGAVIHTNKDVLILVLSPKATRDQIEDLVLDLE